MNSEHVDDQIRLKKEDIMHDCMHNVPSMGLLGDGWRSYVR